MEEFLGTPPNAHFSTGTPDPVAKSCRTRPSWNPGRAASKKGTLRARSLLSCGGPINGKIRPSVLQPKERMMPNDDGSAVLGNSGENVTDFPDQ